MLFHFQKTSTNCSSASVSYRSRPVTLYEPMSRPITVCRPPSVGSTLYEIDEKQPTPPPRRRHYANNNKLSPSHRHSHIPTASSISSSHSVHHRSQSTALTRQLRPLSAVPCQQLRPSSEIITSSHPLSVSDDNTSQVMPIGSVICSFRDIVTSPENRLILDVIGTDQTKSGGQITLLLWEVSLIIEID